MTPRTRRKLHRAAWLGFLLLPPLAVMLTFVVTPIVSAFAYAFYHWDGLARGEFVGLDNFRAVLTQEPFSDWTWRAFRHNLVVLVSLAIVQNGFGFLLAYAISREPFGFKLHRVSIFLPVILSTVIIGFLWKLFLNPFGLVNEALRLVGLDGFAQPWLGQEETALGALIFVNAWHWVGFPALVFLAGIQRIPQDLIDAARLDGAGEWALVRRVVWPLVAPSATIVFVLLFIGAFNWFELPYIMAGLDGSPYGSTDVLGLYFYRTAFGNQSAGVQDFGKGSALAVLIFLFISVVATFWTLYLRRREVEL
jgi:raffinose/stachyose/melibiose transport system permease protein